RGGLLQQTLRAIDDRVIDEFAVELDRGDSLYFGCFEGGDDALGESDLLLAWREHVVHHRNLVRVDAHLALEAIGERRAGRGFERLRVLQIDPDRVERRLEA